MVKNITKTGDKMMRKLSQAHLKSPGLLIGGCFALSVFPLASTVMSWVWILFACALGVMWAKVRRKVKALSTFTLNLLAVFCMLLLVFFSGQFGLLSTMINLLIVAGCLKLITMRSFADFYLIIVVIVFLVACGFIYHQDLLLTIYYALVLFATFAGTFLLNKGKISNKEGIKQAAKLLAQTLPITVILFIMVPRLPPLWEAASNKSSSTGLSETIAPGDIANLAQSGELAFRAEFTGSIPEAQERYWRAIVLDYFDGNTWAMSDELANFDDTVNLEPVGEATRYLIIAEPNDMRWQYSLDYPIVEEVISDRSIKRNNAYQLFTDKENTKASLYVVNSYLSMPLNHYMSNYERQRHLQTPRDNNQRTQDFVEQNINPQMNERERVSAIMQIFYENEFSYTLQPPFMRVNPIDQFLFEYRRGFCSHYASALTYMLRLANIPARLVAGYQGGELQNQNILTVRQYDAHAWVEYWIEGDGWIRIDPTAIVAPNRLMSGLLSSISQEESELVERPFNLSEFEDVALIRRLHDFLVLIDHQWTQSVLRFDQDSQRDLIEQWFGVFNAKNMTTFMFLALGAIALFIMLLFLPYRDWFAREAQDPLSKLLRLLGKHGWHKHAQETLKQFSERIAPQLTNPQQQNINQFVEYYYRAEYADADMARNKLDKLIAALHQNFKKP
jgi:transglutaminase-like putative cysteine protease